MNDRPAARQSWVVSVMRNPQMRASDAEREEVARTLRDSLADGRLSLEEFGERLDAAYGAKTYGELDALLIDLPRPPGRSGTGPMTFAEAGVLLAERWEERRRNRYRRRISRFVTVNGICWTLWGVSVATSHGHHLEGIWPMWVTVPWGAMLLRRPYLRHRHC